MAYQPPLPEPPPPLPGSEPVAEAQTEAPRTKVHLFGAFLALATLALVVVGVGVWIAAPGRCDSASFTSSRFAYCLTTPTGWQSSEVNEQGQAYDTFQKQNGAAAVVVIGGNLQQGDTLDDIVGQIRTDAEQQGITLGEPVEQMVDGVRGIRFDGELEDSQGNKVAFRQVLIAREGAYWIARLQDTPEAFEQNTGAFHRMLASWHFI